MGAFPLRPPNRRDPEERRRGPPSGGRYRNPELLNTERRNKPRTRPPPGVPRSPTTALPPRSGARDDSGAVPCNSVRRPGSRVPPRGLHPRRSSRSGSPTVHQSPHVLVSSPQVCAGLGAAGGRRGRRRARGAGAVGAGTRGAATRAGGRGRGGSRPAVVSARQVAPSGCPQPHTRHARCAPPALPSALRPVRRPPTPRPPPWPRAPHGGRPMGAARGARPPMGASLCPGGREVPDGAGQAPRPPPPVSRATQEDSAPHFGIYGGDGGFFFPPLGRLEGLRKAVPARLRTARARRGEGQSAAGPPRPPGPLSPPLLPGPLAPSPTSCPPDLRSSAPSPSPAAGVLFPAPLPDGSARGPETGPFHSRLWRIKSPSRALPAASPTLGKTSGPAAQPTSAEADVAPSLCLTRMISVNLERGGGPGVTVLAWFLPQQMAAPNLSIPRFPTQDSLALLAISPGFPTKFLFPAGNHSPPACIPHRSVFWVHMRMCPGP